MTFDLSYWKADIGWINNALESAIDKHGSPKHVISDQTSVSTGGVFAELLDSRNIRPRFGAAGKHGSIAGTERLIRTLKYDWLKYVSFIKNFNRLVKLCEGFEDWYNRWRPHMSLDGLRPDDVCYNKKQKRPQPSAKTVAINIEQHLFRETRVTGYRLKDVA